MKKQKIFFLILVLGLFFGGIAFAETPPSNTGGNCPSSTGAPSDTGAACPSQSGCPPGQDTVDHKAFSASNPCKLVNPAPNQLVNEGDFGALLKKIIQILLYFAGSIAVIYLVIGGFQYVMSRGSEEGMEKAKKTIQSAVIGIVLIVMAFAIVTIINTLLTKGASEQAPAPPAGTNPEQPPPAQSSGITVSFNGDQAVAPGDPVSLNFAASPDGNYTWSVQGAPSWIKPPIIVSSDHMRLEGTVPAGESGDKVFNVYAAKDGKTGNASMTIYIQSPGIPKP